MILVLKPLYPGRNNARWLSWLLMSWLIALPGHQQPWYWLCRIKRSLSSTDRGFPTCSMMGNDREYKYIFILLKSLAPGRPRSHFKTAIFNLVLLIGIFTSSIDNPLRWMQWDLTDDKSTLDQVMAWCRQATSHYLNQCWPSSMLPYGVTKPQWVKLR